MPKKMNYERPYFSHIGHRDGRLPNRRLEVAVDPIARNAQADVHSVLPNLVEEIFASMKKESKVSRIPYLCDECGYSSKKWVRNNKCRSKIDCIYRIGHPEVAVVPHYYSTRNALREVIERVEASIASINWTDQEITDQNEFIKERFGL